MKAIYSIVGFPTASLKLEAAPEPPEESFSENFRTSLVAITSFTTFYEAFPYGYFWYPS
ncbi:MAG: hypothetical protein R2769_05655 [Saprospiraceae bacterium]